MSRRVVVAGGQQLYSGWLEAVIMQVGVWGVFVHYMQRIVCAAIRILLGTIGMHPSWSTRPPLGQAGPTIAPDPPRWRDPCRLFTVASVYSRWTFGGEQVRISPSLRPDGPARCVTIIISLKE